MMRLTYSGEVDPKLEFKLIEIMKELFYEFHSSRYVKAGKQGRVTLNFVSMLSTKTVSGPDVPTEQSQPANMPEEAITEDPAPTVPPMEAEGEERMPDNLVDGLNEGQTLS